MSLATASAASGRRSHWLALWAALKGLEALVGHLAERAKARALGYPALDPPEVET